MTINLNSSSSHLHTALISDLAKRLGVDDLVTWIDSEGERVAQKGVNDNSWSVEFTLDLLEECRISDIQSGNIGSEARIVPLDDDKYRIIYKEGLPNFAPYYPRRFAIAHEIGHTYWFAAETQGEPLSPIQRRTGRDHTIEVLCNRFAASLLLPKSRLLRALEILTNGRSLDFPPLQLIPRLSEYFKVAERAIVRRLFFSITEGLQAVICLRPRHLREPLLNPEPEPVSSSWVSSWCAFPNSLSEMRFEPGTKLPFATPKVIPVDMIPDVPPGSTKQASLDVRWFQSIEFAGKKYSKTPFSRMQSTKLDRLGYVCSTKVRTNHGLEDRIYIALLSQ